MQSAPRVSVLVAVHNGARHLRSALESIAAQTVRDLELVVVDDGSTDETPSVLDRFRDPRLRVVRNEERLGLAGALNRGLGVVHGRFVARMDADDIALPYWLERVLARLESRPPVVLVGAGVVELRGTRLGAVHLPEPGVAVTRWHSLFGASPFFHNTVAFDRDFFEMRGLRYDESFGESEDFDLWTRVLESGDADCVSQALVLYRRHPEQASARRAVLQRELGLQVALRQIERTAPSLSRGAAELAWRFGFYERLATEELASAATAYLELHRAFEDARCASRGELSGVRRAVAAVLVRRAREARGEVRRELLLEAIRIDPLLGAHAAARRLRRAGALRRLRTEAGSLLLADACGDAAPIRVAAVFPEPTPYRTPLLDRVAALDEIELSVIYAAPSVVAGRTFASGGEHDATFLRGYRLPGGERVVRHDYPVTPGIARALDRARPDVVVASGWSTFAAQGAIAWCRLRGVPYVLVVESHDEGPRPGWRRKVKGAVVPPIVRGAAGILVTGTLARGSMIARGAPPERIRVFANTVDVEAFGEHADRLRERRPELRSGLGAAADDVLVLSVARLGAEKRLDVLVQAVAAARDSRLLLVIAGEGSERETLVELVAEAGVRARFVGDVEWTRIVELYASADVFALVSDRETWAVVVNEAAACGLPLVLSNRVGAAHDLLRDGENGVLVPAGDVSATAAALRELAGDTERRREMGVRSREVARDWGYGPSVESFLAAVREAVAEPR